MNTQHMTRIKFSILLKDNGYMPYTLADLNNDIGGSQASTGNSCVWGIRAKRDDKTGYNYYLIDNEYYFYLDDYSIYYMSDNNDELFSYNFYKQNISDFNQNLVESSLDLGFDILPVYQRNLKLEELLRSI